MPVEGINSSPLSAEELSGASRAVSKELDKDAFLKLLITELSNQDPMNPMDDREFIAQMAQFSTLEQMTNMTKAMEGLSSMQQYTASSYIGKMVAFQKEDADGIVQDVASKVLAVWFDPKEGVILETELGEIPLNQIQGVA